MATSNALAGRHGFQTDDSRLLPIADKVLARERLDFDDAVALYRSPDILALGWLANHVRERMHGDVTYFNVNRHINPTNVCVAACRLCAFGRKKTLPALTPWPWKRPTRLLPQDTQKRSPNFISSAVCTRICPSSISST